MYIKRNNLTNLIRYVGITGLFRGIFQLHIMENTKYFFLVAL